MRISTNTIYQMGITKINTIQAEQSKLQQQISTGKRITSAADDPLGAARALEISHAKAVNTGYADTRQTAQIKLDTIESNLTQVTSVLVSAQSSLVAAGNATYSDTERGFIATELSGTLESLLNLANTKDVAGNYLYAGFKTDTLPFIANGATFAGDSNQLLLQIDAQQQMAANVTGDKVFQAGGNNVFTAITNIVNLLNTPLTPANKAAFNTGLSTAIGNMQTAVDNVLNVRADVGSKLNELDALNSYGTDRDLQYSKSLSDIQDTDYASALSDFSKQQTIMEAAQKSFVEVTKLSLFNFI